MILFLKAIQEVNSYAIGVWQKVNKKIDGKDLDTTKSLSTHEQVRILNKSFIYLVLTTGHSL